jgi:hypothetical protein
MHIMQIASRSATNLKFSTVGTLELFTVHTTYHSDLCKELHYEGGI